jgi:CheY-like chemotaxis protein
MAKIPANKKKSTLDDWMVRVSFAEAGEADQGFEATELDQTSKLALDKIMVVRSERKQGGDEEDKMAAPVSEERTDDDKLRIMILDDEPIVGKRLMPALSKHGFEVEVFEDPRNALARLEEQAFDIVVTDVRMEEVDGIQVLEHIMSTCEHTRVILITGYATVEVAREALVKGAFDFIAKPFKPKDLRAVVNKAALSLGHRGIL